MNETIGVKGGHQDRRRSLKISKKVVEKLKEQTEQEKIKELEEITRKKQILNFIKIIPMIFLGQLLSKNESPKHEKIEIIPIDKEEIKLTPINTKNKPIIQIEEVRKVKELPKKEKIIDIKEKEEEKKIEEFPYKDNYKANLDNIQNNRLLEEYQKKIKEIKREITKLAYEYKVIEEENNNIYTSKEAETLLSKLSTILMKLDKLKDKYNVENIDRYDENYILVMVEDYINEFENKKNVKEIKNSELYILISEKLNELYSKRDDLEDKINRKKIKLSLDEEKVVKLKEQYDEFNKFNIMLLKFQNDQDHALKDIKEKLENAVTEEEKIIIKAKEMDKQSKKLLSIVGLQLLLPIPKSAKRIVTSTALYLHFMKNMMHPRLETKKYKVIKVEDYRETIEKSIYSIEDIQKLLNKTTKQIDSIIKDLKKEYKEYFGKVKEVDSLLNNLEKIKYEIKDKEEEIKRIKEEQKKNLEKNNEKVKALNNISYQV